MAEAKTLTKEKETPAQARGKRAAKLEKLKQADTINFAVDPAVRAYLAQAAKSEGLDLSHMMQKIVEAYVIDTAPADLALAKRLAAKRQVIDSVQATAAKMDADGAFDEHFILNVVNTAAKDADFAAAYETATAAEGEGDKAQTRARRVRTALNQQMGRVIKRTVGAKSMRKDGGGIERGTATDALIATYTRLVKPA
ncbi:hypothetical protein [uncultured Tateyamaria sp.]|uniref:hypothetical protein n=1 Tax=uncultured Tateyamaria sp. TaxID=455651 RepID=UPI002619BCD8|nr:hypothetical protein [uncultured Tateyamaria sp.]